MSSHKFSSATIFSLSLLLCLLVPNASRAHWPWLEPAAAGKPATANFGVFPDVRMGPPVLHMMGAKAQFWLASDNGVFSPTKPEFAPDDLKFGTSRAVVMDYTYGVHAGHGEPSLVQYTAKAFSGTPIAGASKTPLFLELVIQKGEAVQPGKAVAFQLLQAGKPLANTTVFAYTAEQGAAHNAKLKAAKEAAKGDAKAAAGKAAEAHAHEAEHGSHGQKGKTAEHTENAEIPSAAIRAKSAADGSFSLTFPASGDYQVFATVKQPTSGTHEGKAYSSVTTMSTLRINVR